MMDSSLILTVIGSTLAMVASILVPVYFMLRQNSKQISDLGQSVLGLHQQQKSMEVRLWIGMSLMERFLSNKMDNGFRHQDTKMQEGFRHQDTKIENLGKEMQNMEKRLVKEFEGHAMENVGRISYLEGQAGVEYKAGLKHNPPPDTTS